MAAITLFWKDHIGVRRTFRLPFQVYLLILPPLIRLFLKQLRNHPEPVPLKA